MLILPIVKHVCSVPLSLSLLCCVLQAAAAATSILSNLRSTPWGVTPTTAGSWTSSAQHSAETVTSPSNGNGYHCSRKVLNHFKMSILHISQRQTTLLLLYFLHWPFSVSVILRLVPIGARLSLPMWTKHCWEAASIFSWSLQHTMTCHPVTMTKCWKPA